MEYLELSSFTPPGSLRTACHEGRPHACYGNLLIPAGIAGITRKGPGVALIGPTRGCISIFEEVFSLIFKVTTL